MPDAWVVITGVGEERKASCPREHFAWAVRRPLRLVWRKGAESSIYFLSVSSIWSSAAPAVFVNITPN
jgi:hypothetical protein